jgi:hypothetical protein
MVLRQGDFIVILLLSLVLVVLGCSPKEGLKAAAPIQLTVGTNNQCLQNGATGTVDMYAAGVIWSGPNANTSIEIHLPAGCPFSKCDFGPSTGSIASGPASGSVGTNYPYSSISIGGSSCTVGTDGLIMR